MSHNTKFPEWQTKFSCWPSSSLANLFCLWIVQFKFAKVYSVVLWIDRHRASLSLFHPEIKLYVCLSARLPIRLSFCPFAWIYDGIFGYLSFNSKWQFFSLRRIQILQALGCWRLWAAVCMKCPVICKIVCENK